MQCVILAAGYATRLSPLTDNFPKPLLEVAGKSILDWLLDDLETTGAIRRYLLVSNHRYLGHFQQWAASRTADIAVIDDGTTSNEGRLGAVRDLQLALQAAGAPEDTLVAAGDNLLDFSLGVLLDYFRRRGTSAVMRFREEDAARLRKCGVAVVDDDERITAMAEKSPNPPSQWVVPPFYCLAASDVARVDEALADGCAADAPGSFIAWLAARTPIHAMPMPGRRLDIGTLESYRAAQRDYAGRRG